MKGSYQGTILKVNLSTGDIRKEPLNRKWAEDYIGGKGLGVRYFVDAISPGVDPLGEGNVLVLMNGPLAGTPASSSSKLSFVSKSPHTGTILDCSVGGGVGAKLKYAGYDGVVITGKAKSPVYLLIDGGNVELRPSPDLKGKGIFETEDRLAVTLGSEEFSFLSIGPAGGEPRSIRLHRKREVSPGWKRRHWRSNGQQEFEGYSHTGHRLPCG